jgi:hypothetical protein
LARGGGAFPVGSFLLTETILLATISFLQLDSFEETCAEAGGWMRGSGRARNGREL